MRVLPTFLAALFLATLAPAQVSSPAGYLASEGEGAAVFGISPQGRFMFVDGERRGMPTLINELAYRRDNAVYTQTIGGGRRWASVTIDYAPCDASKRTWVYSAVPLAPPARVFSNAVAWPDVLGRPASLPAVWGGASGALRFPLSRPIAATGADDLSFDYRFRGGVLNNSAPWGFNTYLLDGYRTAQEVHGDQFQYGSGCVDSANQYPALANAVSVTYGPQYRDLRLRNRIRLSFRSVNTAASAPVFHALTVSGVASGARFPGVACERVYLDLLQPSLLFAQTASARGAAETDFGTIPYRQPLAGLPVWFQAAWNDSQTGSIKLGAALSATIAPAHRTYQRWLIWEPTPNAASGLVSDDGGLNPVIRYGR